MQVVELQRKIGDVYGAEATLLTAHRLEPENTEVNFLLGLMLSTTQPESALQFLLSTENLDGNDALLRNALITTIENSVAVTPVEKYQVIGQVYSKFGEWDVAAQAFQSALANDAGSALSWIYLAEAKQQLGLDAFDEVSKALELDGENEIINGLAGLYYRRIEKYELSLYYLKKAAEKNPETNVWVIEQSRTQEEMGQLEAAYQLLISATEISPEDWATWKSLAVFSFTNNYEVETTGLTAARKALILYPTSPVLMDLLGAGLMLTGDYDSAERFFLQADEIDPHQSAILIHLGQLKVLQGKITEARVILQQAVDYAPDDRLRDLALQLLNETAGK
jgi:tetratricopeptide (TPR) repeat protein